MTPEERIGVARSQLEEAQVWARIVTDRPTVVVPPKDHEGVATEIDSRSAALAKLLAARATIDQTIEQLRGGR